MRLRWLEGGMEGKEGKGGRGKGKGDGCDWFGDDWGCCFGMGWVVGGGKGKGSKRRGNE